MEASAAREGNTFACFRRLQLVAHRAWDHPLACLGTGIVMYSMVGSPQEATSGDGQEVIGKQTNLQEDDQKKGGRDSGRCGRNGAGKIRRQTALRCG